MVLAFNHRKFIDIKSQQYCSDLCDNADDSNPDPKLCLSYCVDYCTDKCADFQYLIYSPPPPPPSTSPHRSHKPREFVTISLTLLAAALLSIALYFVYIKWKSARQRRRSGAQINQSDDFVDEDHGPVVDHHVWYIQTVGLQPSVISAISVCQFKKGDGLVEGTECSVCLNEFQEDETLRLLPKCSHAFHIPCIDTWLRSHTNCPMCRAPIVKNIGSSSGSPPSSAPVLADSSSDSSSNLSSVIESRDTQMVNSEENGLRDEIIVEEEEELNEDENEEIVEMQPMRRSVSMDSLSAMKISQALSNIESRETKRVNSSSRSDSLARFVASASIRRSLSCSGKLFLSRSRAERI